MGDYDARGRCAWCGQHGPHSEYDCRYTMDRRIRILESGVRYAASFLRDGLAKEALDRLMILIPDSQLHWLDRIKRYRTRGAA